MNQCLDDPSLIRTLLRILRHAPEHYYLAVDPGGWANLDEVALALRCARRAWSQIGTDELGDFVKAHHPDRFEVEGSQIRARYGHSLTAVNAFSPARPPKLLYHGTQSSVLDGILQRGLKPRGRAYTHLTSDAEYAAQVAEAKGQDAVILHVQAQAAHAAGTEFWHASRHVWLARAIEPCYLSVGVRS